jgi:general secretion pathway protein B
MSLILDALRRADSERERGAVPGLHTQPVPHLSLEASPRRRGARWHWIAVGAVGSLLIALAWLFFGRETTIGATGSTATRLPPAPASSAAGPAATAPVASAAPSSPSPAAAAPATRPGEAAEVAEPAPWPTTEIRKAPDRRIAAAPPAEPTTTVAPVEAPIYTREQLPENVRAELPPLAVGGSIYSNDAASRSVIINGRIYRENDRLATDLSLEQIRLKAAVLKYKGYRFEIQF